MTNTHWLDSNEGKTDDVLIPWPPIALNRDDDGLRISAWGRCYAFSDLPLPHAAESQGRPLLTGPVRLVALVEGHTAEWQALPMAVEEQSPATVVLRQRASAGGLAVEARTRVDYDGMMRIDLTLRPQRRLRLDALTIEIPMPEDAGKYLYTFPNGVVPGGLAPGAPRNFFKIKDSLIPAAIPAGARLAGSFMPFVWLGDEEVGLQWFCESNRNWYNADMDRSLEVTNEDGRSTLRLRLVDMPLQMCPERSARVTPEGIPIMEPPDEAGVLEYTFGFQATPVKPMAQDCWDYRIVSPPWYGRDYWLLTEEVRGRPALDYLAEKGARTILLWNWTDIITYTKPVRHEEQFRRLVEEAHRRGMKVITYFGFQICEAAPEWPEYGEQVVVRQASDNPTTRGTDLYAGMTPNYVDVVCYASAWQDFLVDGIARLIDNYGTDGAYLDSTVRPFPCLNSLHGCGYVRPDGRVEHVYRIFAVRETLRRIYATVKARKPDGVVDAHLAGALNMPAMAWATSYWNGEMLPGLDGRALTDVLPAEYFRVEMMGYQWGVPAEFLHYTLFPDYRPEDFRQACAMPLLHGVPVRPHTSTDDIRHTATEQEISCRAELAVEAIELVSGIWRVFDDFGRKEAQWLPYWRNADAVRVSPEQALASLYLHPRNGVLVVVANLDQGNDVTLSLSLEKLGLDAGCGIRDGLTGEPVAHRAGSVRLPLPYLGWKILWVMPGR